MTPPRTLVLTTWSAQSGHDVRELLEDLLRELDALSAAEGQTPLLSFLELAAEELLTNIFRHGYGTTPGRACVECYGTTEKTRQGVLLRVTDWGLPFDPFTEAPAPDTELNFEDRAVGGLGVFLVKSLAGRCHYERRDATNVVELFFPLAPVEQKDTAQHNTKNAPAALALLLLLALFSAGLLLPHPALAEGVILHYEVVEEERASDAPPPTEYLLDSMNVHALSPHAALLSLPRMVSAPLALALLEGRITAPPQWETLIAEAAQRHGLPPALIAAVIKTESNFRPDTVSHKGAQGLMQLMPATQQYLGVSDPFDPRANVLAGCDYLRQQWKRFGSLDLALAAYNAGPANVIKYGGIPPFTETQNFVRRVRSRMGDK